MLHKAIRAARRIMIYLTAGRYFGIIVILTFFMFFDMFINAISSVKREDNGTFVTLHIGQLICLGITDAILFLLLLLTYITQVGLFDILFKRFFMNIVVIVIYDGITIFLNLWTCALRATGYYNKPWGVVYLFVFGLQRTTAILNYYYMKRLFLRISDPRFFRIELDDDVEEPF